MNTLQIAEPDADLRLIETPPSKPGLLASRHVLAMAANFGVSRAIGEGGALRFGKTVIFARHEDVHEVLARDLDFRIAPINDGRIEEVNGPFVLAEDRGGVLVDERGALYKAFRSVPLGAIANEVAKEAETTLSTAAAGRFDIVREYARPIAAETAVRLFGVQGTSRAALMEVARAIFAHTFLNLGGDEAVRARAIAASQYMRRWIEAEIARRTDQGISGDDLMGGLLALSIDKDLVRRTIGGMLVGSIDTTATCVAKIIAVLGDDPKLTRSVIADLDHPERLAGWCWEILRLWPHNPILLRQPIEDVMFGDMLIRAGSTVVVWTQAAMLDPSAFPDPDRLRPDRPVGNYLHFGGGLHVCAGRAVNGFQIPILVGSLLRRGLRKVGKIDWAGPFPDTLPVELA